MQQTPLEFDRTEGTSLVWNNGSRYKINNVFVSEGTWPKGSTCADQIQPAPHFELMWGVDCLAALLCAWPCHRTGCPPASVLNMDRTCCPVLWRFPTTCVRLDHVF